MVRAIVQPLSAFLNGNGSWLMRKLIVGAAIILMAWAAYVQGELHDGQVRDGNQSYEINAVRIEMRGADGEIRERLARLDKVAEDVTWIRQRLEDRGINGLPTTNREK